MIALKNVLVATDFGEASDAALAYGRDFARTFGATLHVLHIVDDVMARMVSTEAYTFDFFTLQQEIEASARKQLAALVTDDDRRTLQAKAFTRVSANAAAAIVAYATEAAIDVIIVGTHGRGAMAHLLIGSVAERVVRTAPCPVLTVRHPEREFLAPDALQTVARA